NLFAYRRVEGRLPSPRSKECDGDHWTPCKSFPLLRSVAYLVRSFQTYARIRSLTTGTFNRVVKDRIAFRLSGANSVQANPLQERIRLSSKPFNHTALRKTLSTQASHRISTVISTMERSDSGGGPGSKNARSSAQWYGLPIQKRSIRRMP